jgi:FhuF 2Fe-2S C-terminal domain
LPLARVFGMVPASSITDPGWLDAQLAATARWYSLDDPRTIGVLWWYSASSALLGPPVASFDPGLDRVTLQVNANGFVLDARSEVALPDFAKLGRRLEEMLATCVSAVSARSGAAARALWAIATDSLANRVLWAGESSALADKLAAAVGPVLPKPRYVEVSGRLIVRRASCCLIYEAPGQSKCASCPRQTPAERLRRLK